MNSHKNDYLNRARWAIFAIWAVAGSALAQESLSFVTQDNLVRVDVLMDGKPFHAVLDTGVGYLALSPQTSIALALTRSGETLDVARAGKAVVSAVPVTVPSVKFGPLRLRDAQGVRVDMQHLSSSAGFEIDALMGGPVFADRSIRVDYPQQRLTFNARGAAITCAAPMDMEIRAGVPVVTATLQHGDAAPQTVHLIVDLGTRHFAMMLSQTFLSTPIGIALSREGTREQIGTGTGGALDGVAAQLDGFAVNAERFGKTRVALSADLQIPAEIADGTLGVPLWERSAITFDYPNHRICLDHAL